MKMSFYGRFLFLGTLNGNFQPYHVDFFFDGILGANSLSPILIPLVSSLGDLLFERVLPGLFSDIEPSCSSH
jgi:hypothetical protein